MRRLTLLLPLAVWGISLFLPSFDPSIVPCEIARGVLPFNPYSGEPTSCQQNHMLGWQTLWVTVSWVPSLGGLIAAVGLLPNILMIGAMPFLWFRFLRIAFVCGILALVSGLAGLYVASLSGRPPAGTLVWFASFVALAGVGFAQWKHRDK
ncbi:MAG: hypothetical protein HYU30_10665 [Chloroflexi bacterium]|nr:hypothetical protein [Chloroflexota bacterium]